MNANIQKWAYTRTPSITPLALGMIGDITGTNCPTPAMFVAAFNDKVPEIEARLP